LAGYIITLSNEEALRRYARYGVYATQMSVPVGGWYRAHEGTFADYATMKSGDNVYFFIKRKIYGVGELVAVTGDCKFQNWPDADDYRANSELQHRDAVLWDECLPGSPAFEDKEQRWVCTMQPSPFFFAVGVDMDEVLTADPPAFRMLRALERVSFIKIDDRENEALRRTIITKNQEALTQPRADLNYFASESESFHKELGNRIHKEYHLKAAGILAGCADGERLKHEMALEAGVLYQLSQGDTETTEVLGNWDYLSHQVVASPFKPVIYMDRMDLFGYSYIPGYSPIQARYLVGEIKKDAATTQDVDQLMKYVDWVRVEYCGGDYSMIDAILIAKSFPPDVARYAPLNSQRTYTVGKPAETRRWERLRLVSYRWNAEEARLNFRQNGLEQGTLEFDAR